MNSISEDDNRAVQRAVQLSQERMRANLGGPFGAVDDIGVTGIAHALRWRFDGVEQIEPDLLLSLVPPD